MKRSTMNTPAARWTAAVALSAAALTSLVLLQERAGLAQDPPKAQATSESPAATAPLVTKGRVLLNLAGAELVVRVAKETAQANGWQMNIAVVDDGGHLLAFARMDGARPASGTTALTKAISAATFRAESGPFPQGGEPNLLLSASIQHTAAQSGGKITALKGGVPIVVDGQIIGAVGVGGGTGEQDAEVGKAGIAALLAALEEKK